MYCNWNILHVISLTYFWCLFINCCPLETSYSCCSQRRWLICWTKRGNSLYPLCIQTLLNTGIIQSSNLFRFLQQMAVEMHYTSKWYYIFGVGQARWTAVTAAEQMWNLHFWKLYSPELALENDITYICKVIYCFPVSSCRIDRIKERQHLASLFCHCLLCVGRVTFDFVFKCSV